MEWIKRNCPVCGSITADLVYSAPLKADTLSFDEVKNYWRGFRRKSCFFDYFRCHNCQTLYNKNYFDENQLNILYGSMPDNSAGVNHDVLSRTQLGYFEFLTSNINNFSNKKYLEIGPDVGLFTFHASNSKLFNSMTLIEPNSDVHALLNSINKKTKDFNIIHDLNDLSKNQTFDLIVGIHVFDHLIEPMKYINQLKDILSPGSYVLSVTHNESSLLRKIMGPKWIPFCLQHPQLYNPETITNLFKQNGFDVVSIQKTTNWFPLLHLINTLLSLFGRRKIESNFLSSINIPIKLGNMISLFKLN